MEQVAPSFLCLGGIKMSKRNGNILTGDDVLFVEFDDIIKTPSLTLTSLVSRLDTKETQILDTSLVKEYDPLALIEWYIMRKHRNIVAELSKLKTLDESEYEDVLTYFLKSLDAVYASSLRLKGCELIYTALYHKTCDEIIIYSDYTNDAYVKECTRLFGDKVTIVGGDFRQSIRSLPYNSSYVISDIKKLNILYEENKINCTSVLLPLEYHYNNIPNCSEMIQKYCEDKSKPVKIMYFPVWYTDQDTKQSDKGQKA
jgi:hypothetical protein